MKVFKLVYLLLCLVTLFSLSNCSSDDEIINNIEKDYFTIVHANYIDKSLPSGTAQIVSEFNINNYVINGGSAIISFTSTEILKSLNIAIKGINGYYEVKLHEHAPKSSVTEDSYQYEVVLAINQNIAVQNFKLALSVTSVDGQISPISESKDISVIEAGTGKLQVILSWDQEDDLDLHVITPAETHISYNDPFHLKNGNHEESEDKFYFDFYIYLIGKYSDYDTSELDFYDEDDRDTLYGYIYEFEAEEENEEIYEEELAKYLKDNNDKIAAYLDIDSNADCDIDGVKNENIFFNEVQNGEYLIAVDLYSKCDLSKTGAKYSVTLNYGGKTINFSDKQIGQFAKDNEGSGDNPDEYVIIGKFTINDVKSGTENAVSKKNIFSNKKFKNIFSKKK